MDFKIVSDFMPTGDQPEAIEKLSKGIEDGEKYCTLIGATGSGKTFTMANIIEKVQKPTLVIAHNKTLAAQLYGEFKEFFPENAVEYFVSYYDYYQPEAYVVQSDMYIEKDSSINDEIDKLRHSATAALLERRDVIIVASVSCIYGLGDPEEYGEQMISLRPGMSRDRDEVIRKLVQIQYERNDISFTRGTFRVRGDVLEVYPAGSDEKAIRIEFFGDEIDRVMEINYLTGEVLGKRSHVSIFPASHHVTSRQKLEKAVVAIEEELEERIRYFTDRGMLLEAQRIEQRTRYDIEMLREIGICKGIENYSRHLTGRSEGERPYTLMDFFPDDFLIIADESHVMMPQIRAMYGGDRARKSALIDYGFRLPSAYDNRPLSFEEFEKVARQMVFVSATPASYELQKSSVIAQQIIRPTGLLDPQVEIRPTSGQIDDILNEIDLRVKKEERVLVTTLTKKMAEDLTDYMKSAGVKVTYMHSDVETLDRIQIIHDLRSGKYDVLVGINLLREGLDLPEVSLVTILDADKEGFLRSETSLIQTIGRAARHENGKVIMYADKMTDSMKRAIEETYRRRGIQERYNEEHGIIPTTIKKGIRDVIEATKAAEEEQAYHPQQAQDDEALLDQLRMQMAEAAKLLEFEIAAQLRDKIAAIEKKKRR